MNSIAVDFLKDKNPHIKNIKNGVSINWESAKNGKAILGIMRKYSIPEKVEKKHYYCIQEQLYIAIVNLEEDELQSKIYEVFVNIHNEAIVNLTELKASSQYKNDVLFNNFCIALFKG